jgi:hypothetical protein
MLRVLRRNPPVGSESPRVNRARDKATHGVANSWRFPRPIKGARHSQALYLTPSWEVSFMPLCVGWHLAVRVFPPGITWERHLKPPDPDLIGGGGISP